VLEFNAQAALSGKAQAEAQRFPTWHRMARNS